MKQLLPREMLWADLKTMDEFFKLDPVNEHFFEAFITLREEPFAIHANEIKVFNEVYYQVTRIIFEYPMPNDLHMYVNDIKANMGWNYSAELVMSMAYFMISLIEKNDRPLNKFFTKAINEKFYGCLYWKPFKHCFEKLKKRKCYVKYRFHPRPQGVAWLKEHYIHWNEITNNYDLLRIERVINLWSRVEEKREVAIMINNSLLSTPTFKNAADMAHIKHFMEVYYIADDESSVWKCEDETPWIEYDRLKERVKDLVQEKGTLLQRIADLESEIERINALLEKKKEDGTARKFTLLQIVEYCKNCVDWDDVKSIVAMLNKLLRRIATDEDNDLVDGIETVFRNRLLGNVKIEKVDQVNAVYGNNAVIQK